MTVMAERSPFPLHLWRPRPAVDPETQVRERLAAGDERAALTLLMETFGRELYRYCRSLLADAELASEVHQTVFVQAWEGLAGFRGEASLKTWLFGIARHRCLDAAKVSKRRERRFLLTDALPETPVAGPDAAERLSSRARRQALATCLDELAPHVKDAVLLRYQQELSYVEMSELTREQAPTLQARVARALPVLRRCLEGRGATP